MASPELTRAEIVHSLRALGLETGQVALVHSAMRTLGRVAGGADTVVDAMLEVVGQRGTLVVPTYTFAHEIEADPIIDPATDRSEMGAITEAARRRPDAQRSTAYRHSFAAIGRRAGVLGGVDPAHSAYDLRSSFGVMLALDAQIVLLGVTYSSCTACHFAEWLSEVPYRHALPLVVRVRRSDGTLVEQAMTDYQPKPSADGSYYGSRATDFNRLGRMLEVDGRVAIGPVGNAMVRRVPMRALVARAEAEAALDYNVFRTAEGRQDDYTPLPDGHIVMSPPMLDAAGRPAHYQWAVVDPAAMPPEGGATR